jgi:NarL family two-component system response regulator LiaR
VIRILVADDHTIVRKGIRALLATEPDIEVIGEARDGREAIAQARELCPDVVLMDLMMPGMDGLEATRQITKLQPEVRILVLTNFPRLEGVFPAIEAGAMGYLLKDSRPSELVRAIREVHRGAASPDLASIQRLS